METGDVIVYGVAHKHEYIARFDEEGWMRWPAVMNGWRQRKRASEDDVDTSRELEPRLARIALKLSGVTA